MKREDRAKDPDPASDFNRPPIVSWMCAVEGCTKRRRARGWCGAHYERWRRWGDPTGMPPKPTPPSPEEIAAEMRQALARAEEELR